ncbi:hypothetical protein KKA14_19375 [bacterium]|nr:hypothetical protein [bacterium]
MEKSELKAGQLLDIKEKNGKLIREYVAGFFGEEPIIKQRLLTPQEARIYREDIERGKKSGKTQSEAAKSASTGDVVPGKRLVKRKKIVRPGTGEEVVESSAEPVDNEKKLLRKKEPDSADKSVEQPGEQYMPEKAANTEEFINALVNGEEDKPNYKPGMTKSVIEKIKKIGSPDMKIYRIGKRVGSEEGEFYSQKEYIARKELGLPIWKTKPQIAKTAETTEA